MVGVAVGHTEAYQAAAELLVAQLLRLVKCQHQLTL